MRSVKPRVSPRKKAASKSRGSKSAKSAVPRKILSADTETCHPREPVLNQPKPAKRSRDRIPPPQQERIRQKYIAGKGITEISREEGRNRETVAKIVHSDEMREHVLRMREKFYGLSESALEVVRGAIELEMNSRLAYKVLEDSGVIPTPGEHMHMMAQVQTRSEEDAVLLIMAKLIGGGIFKLRVYGMDTTEEEERLAKAGGRVDENGRIVPLETSPESTQTTIRSDRSEKKQRPENGLDAKT